MVLQMPRPYRHPKTGVYWYRQRVPAHLRTLAKGKQVVVRVDGVPSTYKVGDELKVSLRTKDPLEAKRKAMDVQAEFDRIWQSFTEQPISLTLRQAVALAGEFYHTLRQVLEDDPGETAKWAERYRQLDALEARKQASPRGPLMIGAPSLEARLGSWVDGALAEHHLVIDAESRQKVLEQFDKAARDLALLLERRGKGDFSKDTTGERFPPFEPPATPAAPESIQRITFDDLIEAEAERRSRGRDSKPLAPNSIRKFKFITSQLAEFRGEGGDNVLSLSRSELEAWRDAMLEAGEVGNRTIADRIATVKTVVNWGSEVFKDNARLAEIITSLVPVKLPDFQRKPSNKSAYTPEEAIIALRAARREQDARKRWLPWICAYTGLRIGEASSLEKEDFFQSQGLWFIDVSSSGKRRLKTLHSQRMVPVHRALLDEGLLEFVKAAPSGRLFSRGATNALVRWVRNEVGLKRQGLQPNHGWRHLFEDLCRRDQVSDDARHYLLGRATGRSDEAYGRTLVMLPGLWRELAKVERLPVDEEPYATPKGRPEDRTK